jgi:hypothetical protein
MLEANSTIIDSRHSPGEHETSDAGLRGLVLFGVGLAALIALVFLVSWWIFIDLLAISNRSSPPTTLTTPSRALPPPPRLDGLEGLAPNDASVGAQPLAPNEYGWVDRKAGIIRIPVAKAMDIIADQLSVRSSPANANQTIWQQHSPEPSPANSGRSAGGQNP